MTWTPLAAHSALIPLSLTPWPHWPWVLIPGKINDVLKMFFCHSSTWPAPPAEHWDHWWPGPWHIPPVHPGHCPAHLETRALEEAWPEEERLPGKAALSASDERALLQQNNRVKWQLNKCVCQYLVWQSCCPCHLGWPCQTALSAPCGRRATCHRWPRPRSPTPGSWYGQCPCPGGETSGRHKAPTQKSDQTEKG